MPLSSRGAVHILQHALCGSLLDKQSQRATHSCEMIFRFLVLLNFIDECRRS